MKKLSKAEIIEKCQQEEYRWNFTDYSEPLLYTQPTSTYYIGYETDNNEKNAFIKRNYVFDLIDNHESWVAYPRIKNSLLHHVNKSEYVVILPLNFRIGIFSSDLYFPALLRKGFTGIQDFDSQLVKVVGENLTSQALIQAIQRIRTTHTSFSSNKIDKYLNEVLMSNTSLNSLEAIMLLLDPQRNNVSLLTVPEQCLNITSDMIWWTDSPCILIQSSWYTSLKQIL